MDIDRSHVRWMIRGCWGFLVATWILGVWNSDHARCQDTRMLRPNMLILMADDLGWGDVGAYGGSIPTPNIDRLAARGVRFTSGYSSASTCTPTRFSLLTGTYAFRQKGTGVAPPNSPSIIRPDTVTMADTLHGVGYRTAILGKWHLGLGDAPGPDWNGRLRPGPLDLGFDHCLLLPTTNDRVPQVLVEDDRVLHLDARDPLWVGDKSPSSDHPDGITHRASLTMDWSHGHNGTIHNGVSRIGYYTGGEKARFRDEDLSDLWIAECRRWLAQEREKPFLLHVHSHAIHVPRVVHERFQGVTPNGPRGDAIAEFDASVGAIMEILQELELEQSTLVVLCSDNGPVLDDGYVDQAIEKLGMHDPNGPFRGGKYNVFEGGTRTPFIVSWPGVLAPGVSDEIVCTIDLPRTLSRLGKAPIPSDAFPDSEDLSQLFSGNIQGRGRDHLVTQDNGQSGSYGYREGKWKLIRSDSGRASNVQLRLVPTSIPNYQLFDLSQDPSETNDCLATHPEIAEGMRTRLQALIDAPAHR